MNSSVYIFGNLSSGYTQYPYEETTSLIFREFYTKAKATTQIAIRRDGNLMYYAYIRQLEQGKYIGFCVLLNGVALTRFERIFSLFENVISNLATNGYLIKYNDSGNLIAHSEHLYVNREEIELVTDFLKGGFDSLQSTAMELPPVDYAISNESVKGFVVEDDSKEILKSSYTNGYTYIYKSNDFNTALMNSYRGVLSKLNEEKTELLKKNKELKKQYSQLQLKQRNTQWVGILSVIVAILGGILYFKVINPSEVTKYQTKDFIYYGPLKDKKPHGIGVAFYPQDDVDGRKFYIGNFENGVRQDSTAMLYYREGDYFYGKMKDDKWENGLLYKCSDGTYFRGSFQENIPYNGVWYDHVKRYKSVKGEIVY